MACALRPSGDKTLVLAALLMPEARRGAVRFRFESLTSSGRARGIPADEWKVDGRPSKTPCQGALAYLLEPWRPGAVGAQRSWSRLGGQRRRNGKRINVQG
jgi:hypothetical protein